MASKYQERITDILRRTGRTELDPAIVEAWMRVEHPFLENLTPAQFGAAVAIAWGLAKVSSASGNAALAATYGLITWAEADAFDGRKAVQ